ncbi:MAG TPA: hypothetical protein VF618_08230 [Thermoanaerobaculia bacterium]
MNGKTVCLILGIGFLLIGIAGFAAPALLGMHLSATHSVIHLVSGAAAAWIGWKGSLSAAKTFCIVFGLVYLGLGIAGFVAGTDGAPTSGHPGPSDARMLKVIPGVFEVGTADHVVHILLGGVFLLGGLMTRAAGTVRPVRT